MFLAATELFFVLAVFLVISFIIGFIARNVKIVLGAIVLVIILWSMGIIPAS